MAKPDPVRTSGGGYREVIVTERLGQPAEISSSSVNPNPGDPSYAPPPSGSPVDQVRDNMDRMTPAQREQVATGYQNGETVTIGVTQDGHGNARITTTTTTSDGRTTTNESMNGAPYDPHAGPEDFGELPDSAEVPTAEEMPYEDDGLPEDELPPEDPPAEEPPTDEAPNEDTPAKCEGENCGDAPPDPSLWDLALEFGKGILDQVIPSVPSSALEWGMAALSVAAFFNPVAATIAGVVGLGMLAYGVYDLYQNWDDMTPEERFRALGGLSPLPKLPGGGRGPRGGDGPRPRDQNPPRDVPKPKDPPTDTIPPPTTGGTTGNPPANNNNNPPTGQQPPSNKPPGDDDGLPRPRPKPDRVMPSGQPGDPKNLSGTPTKVPEPNGRNDEQVRGPTRENEAGRDLAVNEGFKVEQLNDKVKHPDKPGFPDYRIEGEFFDGYAPKEPTSTKNVADVLAKKQVRQADRMVLNIDDHRDLDLQDLFTQLRRDHPDIKEVIVVRDGHMFARYPS